MHHPTQQEQLRPYGSYDDAMVESSAVIADATGLGREVESFLDNPDMDVEIELALALHVAQTVRDRAQQEFQEGIVPLAEKFPVFTQDIAGLMSDLASSHTSIAEYAESRMLGRAEGPYVVLSQHQEERYAGNYDFTVDVRETLFYNPEMKIGVQFIEESNAPRNTPEDFPKFRLVYPDGTCTETFGKSNYYAIPTETYNTVAELTGVSMVVGDLWKSVPRN